MQIVSEKANVEKKRARITTNFLLSEHIESLLTVDHYRL